MTSVNSGKGFELRPDVFYYTNQIVNIVFIGEPGSNNWLLVDAGMPHSAKEVIAVARERFGEKLPAAGDTPYPRPFRSFGQYCRPYRRMESAVYAHPFEFPFLNSTEAYPEPDGSVEGGLLAKISPYYPNEPINIVESLNPLPEDGTVPFISGWKWIHTPGHSPGHVSFFREADKTLIAGDAFVTVKADKFYNVLVQKKRNQRATGLPDNRLPGSEKFSKKVSLATALCCYRPWRSYAGE